MVTVLVTSILLLAVILVAIYRLQRATPNEILNRPLPPSPDYEGLFVDSIKEEQARFSSAQLEQDLVEKRTELLARAENGDKEALPEAHRTGDEELYGDVLDALVRRAENEGQVLSLASYIVRSSERMSINKTLAEAFTKIWKNAPNRRTTSEMMHLSALAGDAAFYHQTTRRVLECWHEQRLSDITAEELVSLVESEYWLIPTHERSSGAGFLLKREMAKIRRELLDIQKT